MIYTVRHLTTYEYEAPVTFARCVLRLTPKQGIDQRLLEHVLLIAPTPTRQQPHIGQFGETVVAATVETPHRELRIEARSRVEVVRPALAQPVGGPSWEAARDDAFDTETLDVGSPAQFLYPTPMTPIVDEITGYARGHFTPRRPILEAAFELTRQIKRDFVYDPKSTEVGTPVLEAFRKRHGVCQDFAHIMVSALRGLGLPAAYVSGYLRTYAPPGQPRLEGADATHAWVSLWCGADFGWIGFDPTNALIVAENHIAIAMGRDYADVAPIGGVILSPGDQAITVAVDVMPDPEPAMAVT